MPDTPDELSKKLLHEGEKTLAFFHSLSVKQFDCIVYSEGIPWSVRELLAHFVTAELALIELIADILAGGQGAPVGFDIDAFNQRKVLALQDVQVPKLLQQFREARRQTVLAVAEIPPEQLHQEGRHPFLGIVPLLDIIKLIYRHNQIHQRDLRKVVGTD